MGIAEDMQYKIGGAVPVWMAAGGLSLGYVIWQRKKAAATAAANAATAAAQQQAAASSVANQTLSSTSAADEIDPSTGMTFAQEQSIDPATGTSYLSEWESANQMFTSPYLGTTGLPGSGVTYQTNAQWEEAAINYLIANGFDPSTVTSAIQSYFSGGTPSAQAQSLISLAEQKLGAPPEGTSGIVPTATSSTPSTPPVKSGYGYGGQSFTYNGMLYEAFPNDQAANDWLAKGKPIMYQPEPSVAAPWDTALNGNYNGSPTWLYYPVSG